MTMRNNFFFQYLGPDVAWAQCEAAGISIRIGNRAWVFGRLDYRDHTCPRWWPRFILTLGHKTYEHRSRLWRLRAFGRTIFNFGDKER